MTTTTTPNTDPFRPVIRKAIERKGLNISSAAREAEVGRCELSLYLNGRRGFKLDKLGRVLDALDIELRAHTPKRRRRKSRG